MADIIASGRFSVVAGDATKVVSGVFGSSAYMVQPSFPWDTDHGIRNKQSSQFTIDMGTAAPGAYDVDYTVIQLD